MARIPPEELERLKREVSVQQLAEARGVELKRHGKDLVGLCPFHDDSSPSFVVSPDKNLWNCLGACQAGGSPIDFVMRDEGVDFREAADRLRARMGWIEPDGSASQLRPSATERSSLVAEPDADDATLLGRVVAHYHERLKQTPHALAYLSSRGLGDDELIDTFRLGFADRSLGYRLPARSRVAGERLRSRLQRLGILRDSGHEHFCGCVVFPIVEAEGRVVQLYGRRTAAPQRGASKHLYYARSASRGAQCRGSADEQGAHPVRVGDRRADVLDPRLSQRDGLLRHQRVHRRAPGSDQALRHRAGADRLRRRRGRRPGG